MPENEVAFEDEVENYNFPTKQTMRLKKLMGYEKHRIVKSDTCVSDLAIFGVKSLLDRKLLCRDEIGAIVLVTQSPDYFMPPTSNIIQGKLNLSTDVICLDINQGCAGYEVGLMQAFMMLETLRLKKVVLINADVLSRKISKKDRNSYPLIGDAATITIVENSEVENKIYMTMNTDGDKAEALMIKAGAFKMPANEDTRAVIDEGDGNLRSLEHLRMDGTTVFNFVQLVVPGMIDELFQFAQINKQDIEWYLFHQPNKFMLEKLADRMGISREKMPMNIVSLYGNSSGCTVPINIIHNLGNRLMGNPMKCCLAGFGSGLTWASMVIELGNMDFNESIIAPY